MMLCIYNPQITELVQKCPKDMLITEIPGNNTDYNNNRKTPFSHRRVGAYIRPVINCFFRLKSIITTEKTLKIGYSNI